MVLSVSVHCLQLHCEWYPVPMHAAIRQLTVWCSGEGFAGAQKYCQCLNSACSCAGHTYCAAGCSPCVDCGG